MVKKKKRKRSERSAENKRKWAEKRAAEAEAKKTTKKKKVIKKQTAEKPTIEKSKVETTPWPKAGDNKEFEEILGKIEPIEHKAQAGESKEPEEAALKVSDVAEWVKWPFSLWSTSQDLPPIIKPDEALEIAEPLTRIMNRHGVSNYIPPDVIDGMQVVGRTIPVVKHGNDLVKLARERRAKAGQGTSVAPSPSSPQGAVQTKPIEVGGG